MLRDAGEIPYRIIGIDGCVRRRIDDGAQSAGIIIHVADVSQRRTQKTDKHEKQRGQHEAAVPDPRQGERGGPLVHRCSDLMRGHRMREATEIQNNLAARLYIFSSTMQGSKMALARPSHAGLRLQPISWRVGPVSAITHLRLCGPIVKGSVSEVTTYETCSIPLD